MEEAQQIAIHCHGCSRVELHEAKKVYRDSWSEVHAPIVLDHELEISLLVCTVCRNASMRVATGCEQISDDWLVSFVPPAPVRSTPQWLEDLPSDAGHIAQLLRQVHAALANQQLWLVAMGCRTLIDMFALARVGDVGGFKAKLKRLVDERFLSQRDCLVVEPVVDVGHGATHRTQAPSSEDCHHCLNIVENLLHRLTLDGSASLLQERHAKDKRGKPQS